MNTVGIDISLTSTGLYIIKDNQEYYFNYYKSDKLSKLHNKLDFITYRLYDYKINEDFSNNEILKMLQYNDVTNKIIEDILTVIGDSIEDTIVTIESYNYNATRNNNSNTLIDTVAISTLLRIKILKEKFKIVSFIPPTSLKKYVCESVYGLGELTKKGKPKKPSANKLGIPGGKFTKSEMFLAMMESKYETKLKSYLTEDVKYLYSLKNIPKPLDDIIDAMWLAYIGLEQYNI